MKYTLQRHHSAAFFLSTLQHNYFKVIEQTFSSCKKILVSFLFITDNKSSIFCIRANKSLFSQAAVSERLSRNLAP